MKAIDLRAGQEAVDSLKEETTASLVDFIDAHFESLSRSRKSLREKYDLLRGFQLDVGTFQSFKTTYYQVKKRRGAKKTVNTGEEPARATPSAPLREPPKAEPAQTRKTPEPIPNAGLRPILLPDGTPVDIDPGTGAKTFKI